MRKLLAAASLGLLLLTGCNFDTRHWPRSSGTQTVIYLEDHTASYQRLLIAEVAQEISRLSVRVELVRVPRCPTPTRGNPAEYEVDITPGYDLSTRPTSSFGSNCVSLFTVNTDPHGGGTFVNPEAYNRENPRLSWAVVHLDDGVAHPRADVWSRATICHEMLHALGGGLPPSVHDLCDYTTGHPRPHDIAELDRVHANTDLVGPPGVQVGT
jgi:hypothetical protein